MCVVHITLDAVKVVLFSRPSHSLFLARVVSCLFFFSPFSTFHFFRVFLSSRSHACVYTERGKFRRSALYLRRASTSNGFDALGRNAYLSRAECVCHTSMCRAIPHARVRARRAHARTSRYRATRGYSAQGRRGRIHTHAHTHGPHGRELCPARDVKLLAIS